MADDEPSSFPWVRDLFGGAPKQKYRHTCFVWQPAGPSNDPAHRAFVCVIANNGALDGRSVRVDWTRSVRPLSGTTRLIAAVDDMTVYEFQDVLTKAGHDVVEGRVSGVSKSDLAIERLGAWRPPQREAGRKARPARLYVAEVESEFEDTLYDPDDIGGSSCVVL